MAFPIKKATIDWTDYLRIFQRRRWSFIIPAVSVFILVMVISLFLPRVYMTRTLINVEEEKVINPLIKDLAVSASVSSRLDTLREEILSWPRLVELVTKLDMAKDVRTKADFEDLIMDIRERIWVNMQGDNLITISYEDRDPKLTQQVVQTITDAFIEANLMSQTQESQVAIDFIKKQLAVYATKLEDSEKIQTLFEVRAELEALERDRLVLTEQMSGQRRVIVSEVTTQANPVAAQLRQRVATKELELTAALADSTEEHPRVIMLRREIFETQARLQKETDRFVASEKSTSNPVYQVLEEKLKVVEVEIDTLKKKEASLIPIAKVVSGREINQHHLAEASRNTRVNEQIYAMLLKRLETANITERLEVSKQGTRFHILEPARFPVKPIKPNRFMLILMGLALAIGSGVGFVVVAEMFDHSIRNADEARLAVNLRFLGEIPKIVTSEDMKAERRNRELKVKKFQDTIAHIKRQIFPASGLKGNENV